MHNKFIYVCSYYKLYMITYIICCVFKNAIQTVAASYPVCAKVLHQAEEKRIAALPHLKCS